MLSERIRPGVEAAPWVCEEIRKLEEEVRDIQGVFDTQWARDSEIMAQWQAEAKDGSRALTLPDRGNLVEWLANRCDKLQEELDSLRARVRPGVEDIEKLITVWREELSHLPKGYPPYRALTDAIHAILPPDHTALVRQLVEALKEAKEELFDYRNALESQGWTRHKDDEIAHVNLVMAKCQEAIAAVEEPQNDNRSPVPRVPEVSNLQTPGEEHPSPSVPGIPGAPQGDLKDASHG